MVILHCTVTHVCEFTVTNKCWVYDELVLASLWTIPICPVSHTLWLCEMKCQFIKWCLTYLCTTSTSVFTHCHTKRHQASGRNLQTVGWSKHQSTEDLCCSVSQMRSWCKLPAVYRGSKSKISPLRNVIIVARASALLLWNCRGRDGKRTRDQTKHGSYLWSAVLFLSLRELINPIHTPLIVFCWNVFDDVHIHPLPLPLDCIICSHGTLLFRNKRIQHCSCCNRNATIWWDASGSSGCFTFSVILCETV